MRLWQIVPLITDFCVAPPLVAGSFLPLEPQMIPPVCHPETGSVIRREILDQFLYCRRQSALRRFPVRRRVSLNVPNPRKESTDVPFQFTIVQCPQYFRHTCQVFEFYGGYFWRERHHTSNPFTFDGPVFDDLKDARANSLLPTRKGERGAGVPCPFGNRARLVPGGLVSFAVSSELDGFSEDGG